MRTGGGGVWAALGIFAACLPQEQGDRKPLRTQAVYSQTEEPDFQAQTGLSVQLHLTPAESGRTFDSSPRVSEPRKTGSCAQSPLPQTLSSPRYSGARHHHQRAEKGTATQRESQGWDWGAASPPFRQPPAPV